MIQNSELQIEPEAATHATSKMALFYLLYSTTATSSKEKASCIDLHQNNSPHARVIRPEATRRVVFNLCEGHDLILTPLLSSELESRADRIQLMI
jgi:hypothetical protein